MAVTLTVPDPVPEEGKTLRPGWAPVTLHLQPAAAVTVIRTLPPTAGREAEVGERGGRTAGGPTLIDGQRDAGHHYAVGLVGPRAGCSSRS